MNPVTRTDWEGKGVQPDVTVPAGRALLTAQIMAIEAVIKRGSDDASRVADLGRVIVEKEKILSDLKNKEN